MTCNKKCSCHNCELLQENHYITVIDDRYPFNQKRYSFNGFKCGYTGKCAIKLIDLKKRGFIDDLIFTSEDKVDINIDSLVGGNYV